jgi:hypothetical protein
MRLVSLAQFNQKIDLYGSSDYCALLTTELRSRYEGRVRSTCGVNKAILIASALGTRAFAEDVPGSGTAVAERTLRAVAYSRFIGILAGPAGPSTKRLARLAMLMRHAIPLGTLRNSPREWVVLVPSLFVRGGDRSLSRG